MRIKAGMMPMKRLVWRIKVFMVFCGLITKLYINDCHGSEY